MLRIYELRVVYLRPSLQIVADCVLAGVLKNSLRVGPDGVMYVRG